MGSSRFPTWSRRDAELFGAQSERDLTGQPLALAITVAWTVMFSRVVVKVAAPNVDLLKILWMPMAASAAVGLVYCVYLHLAQRTDEEGEVSFSNPFELGPAVKFGPDVRGDFDDL